MGKRSRKRIKIVNMKKIGICIVAYNRVDSLKRLFQSLDNAQYDQNVDLFVSIDKSDSLEVAEYSKSFDWRNGSYNVIEHPQNLGLRRHILKCGELLSDYDALVVLEDDIIVSPNFMSFTIQCVEKYYDVQDVAGISLYSYNTNYLTSMPFNPLKGSCDVYAMNCAQSWGQVWMKNQWSAFMDWYKVNSEDFSSQSLPNDLNTWPKSSWLKYHTRYCIEQNKFFIYPYYSLSSNNSDIGEHVTKKSNLFQSKMQYHIQKEYALPAFDEIVIKYDGFFEPLFLASSLGISQSRLCVDLNGIKNRLLYKNYLLSCKKLDYKIVKTFARDYKPIEMNILMDNRGEGVFLYDTSITQKNNAKISLEAEYKNTYGYAFEHMFKIMGIRGAIFYMFRVVISKIFK